MRIVQQRIEYLFEQKDGMPAAIVPSVQAFEKWPKMSFNYLEQNIHFEAATIRDENPVTEFDGVLGQPINIKCECFFLLYFDMTFLFFRMKFWNAIVYSRRSFTKPFTILIVLWKGSIESYITQRYVIRE